MKIKVEGTSIKIWYDGNLRFDLTDSSIDAGGVALAGDQCKFDDLKIGYDNNDDDDIDDVGDDVVLSEGFGSTSTSFTYDDAGNLTDDGTFEYIYDAWYRLVKCRASEDSDVTIQEAEFDGLDRRIKKVVSNSGDFDGTVVYLYNGAGIIETRDGSSNVVQQFIWGTQYIDELVMMRVKDKGDLYVHQDANWNIIALTDLGGHVVERYLYTPYGQMTVYQETSYGDYDGDQVIEVGDDRDGYSGSSPTGAERILDLDFDGDVDGTDETLFDNNLTLGNARHPGRSTSGVVQPFGHQGLLLDPEISSYQNRHRQFSPKLKRFLQRDPAGYGDGMNLYEYCGSNPIVRVDYKGLSITSSCNPHNPYIFPAFATYKTGGSGTLGIPDYFTEDHLKKDYTAAIGWLEPGSDILIQHELPPVKRIAGFEFIDDHGLSFRRPCYFNIYARFDLKPDDDFGTKFWHNPPELDPAPTWDIAKIPPKFTVTWAGDHDPTGSSEPILRIEAEVDLRESHKFNLFVYPGDAYGQSGFLGMQLKLSCKKEEPIPPSIPEHIPTRIAGAP